MIAYAGSWLLRRECIRNAFHELAARFMIQWRPPLGSETIDCNAQDLVLAIDESKRGATQRPGGPEPSYFLTCDNGSVECYVSSLNLTANAGQMHEFVKLKTDVDLGTFLIGQPQPLLPATVRQAPKVRK